jgi:hypothetical protein
VFSFVRRSCLGGCLGCLLPLLVLAAIVLYGVHQMLTPPDFAPVKPVGPAAVQLAVASGVESALAAQQPVALIQFTDSEATSLLQDSLPGYVGLGSLEVHSVGGQIVVSGETAILGHAIVVSGPVELRSGGGTVVSMSFKGLSIGQLGLPKLIPELLTRGLSPQFNLALVAQGRDVSFACAAAPPGLVVVGVYYGSSHPPAASYCRGTR